MKEFNNKREEALIKLFLRVVGSVGPKQKITSQVSVIYFKYK